MSRALVLAVVLAASSIHAQRLNIRSYAPEDGLAGAPVWRIYQDPRGVMWFATEGGVSSYDGVNFGNLTVENGLPSAYTELVTRARDGNLWIGTRTGLVRYDGRSLKMLTAAHGRWADRLDQHGNIWYGDSGAIYVFDGTTVKVYSEGLAGEEVYSVTPIGNSIFIGRRETGAVELLVDGTKLLGVNRYRPADGLAHPTVRAIVRDRDGRTYFGTRGGGITRFDGKSFTTFDTRHGLPSNDIYAMLITRRGELVVGTLDNGLAICDLPDFRRCRTINIENGLHARSVFTIFEDRESNLWIGLVNGVSKLMSLHAESYTEQQGLPSDHVYGVFAEPNDEVWVGTLGGLGHRGADGRWTVYGARDGLPSLEVRDIVRDRSGRLWIGTARGLCTTQDPSRGFKCFTRADGLVGDYVTDLHLSRTGEILIGASGGGYTRILPVRDAMIVKGGRQFGIGINAIAEDRAGGVWIATSGAGVIRMDANGMRQFRKADGLGGDEALTLYADDRGGVWVGLHGGGLSHLAPGAARFITFGSARGLRATTVSAIATDHHGRLWLGTNRGIHKIDPRAAMSPDIRLVIEALDERDGLIGRDVPGHNALAVDATGKLWAGFLRGLTHYDPALREPNRVAPTAAIVRVVINGRPVDHSAPLRLDHRRNNLRFEFRGLSFRDERDVRYRYELEGFDPDWSPVTDQPHKEYTNLDPGRYEFRVLAANGDGVWSQAAATVRFAIRPPFWNTWWFRIAALTLLIALIWLAHRLRVRHVEQHNRELELTVAARTDEIRQHALELEDRVQKRTAELAHQALHDVLTGLPNRNLLMDRLEQAIARGRRHTEMFALLFLDLDRFKVVNDSLGHFTGDQLLIGTARRLEASIRPGDTVSRLGGDEFVIFLDQIGGSEDALTIVRRIQERLSEPFHVAGHELYVTASIGVTTSSTADERAEAILRDADIAMYRAKMQGRARYEIFDEWMRSDARALMELETDLRRAVERNEFSVLYQPVIALDRGKLWGFEALVRWEHPSRGRISPADFLPLADETGLIVAIDRIVLDETCRQLRRWRDAFPSHAHHVSVNLSSRQFHRDDLVESVVDCVENAGIDAPALGLEITEGTIMENAGRATEVLAELRRRGVQWSIDDFGTGYSSLSYLHRFPVDVLKIDQSFVRRIGPRGENTEIIRTIMSLARSLGMRVVAEGVETPEQLAHLVARGCDFGQGYYFAHPLEEAEATQMIMQPRPEWAFATPQ